MEAQCDGLGSPKFRAEVGLTIESISIWALLRVPNKKP